MTVPEQLLSNVPLHYAIYVLMCQGVQLPSKMDKSLSIRKWQVHNKALEAI